MAIRRTNGTPTTRPTTPTINIPDSVFRWGRASDNGPKSPGVNWTTQETINETVNIVPPLSTSDILNARYQAAYNQWNTNLADAYKALNQENTAYNRVANQIADYYNVLAQDTAKREQWLAWAKYDVANRLFNDMANQRDYVYGLYGPQGTFTREVNTYYDDLWDYLASEAGREMAYADALWAQSWASLGMMRAQRNQAYNEAFQRSLQVMQQELDAKQNIQQNLINFMTALRQEYWDTANAYIISQYERANNLLNAISQNIATTNANIATARLSAWWGGWQSQSQQQTRTWDDYNWLEKTNAILKWWNDWLAWNNISSVDYNKNWDLVWYTNSWSTITLISADQLKNSWLSAKWVANTLSWAWVNVWAASFI